MHSPPEGLDRASSAVAASPAFVENEIAEPLFPQDSEEEKKRHLIGILLLAGDKNHCVAEVVKVFSDHAICQIHTVKVRRISQDDVREIFPVVFQHEETAAEPGLWDRNQRRRRASP
jgi:hypothetical protein